MENGQQNCVFCRIVAGEIPAHIVFDDVGLVGFLDHRPLFPGHVLLIPRTHWETLADLPDDVMGPLILAGKRIAAAVQSELGAQGSFIALNNVVSQSVPHLHVHIVPRTKGDGLKGFFWPRHAYESEELQSQIAAKLRRALQTSGSSG